MSTMGKLKTELVQAAQNGSPMSFQNVCDLVSKGDLAAKGDSLSARREGSTLQKDDHSKER